MVYLMQLSYHNFSNQLDMKIEICTNELLSENEIKEIAIETVKDEVKRYLRGNDGSLSEESNLQRVVSNHAYKFLFDEVNAIVPGYKNLIVEKIEWILNNKDLQHDIFKKKDVWDIEEGFGWKVATEEMKKNEELIREKVRDAISSFDYKSAVIEKVTDEVANIASSIYNIAELLREKQS